MAYKPKNTIVLCSRSDCTKQDCPNYADARIKGNRFDYSITCIFSPDYKTRITYEYPTK